MTFTRSSAHLFCWCRSLVSGVQCDVKNCLIQLYVGFCHVVSAETMAVPIENPADCEVRCVIYFLQAEEILGYLVEDASSRVKLFCCTTMNVRILSGRQKPCFVSNSIAISSSILRIVRTWYLRTFSCYQKWRSAFKWLRAEECCRRPHGMTRIYTNWCQSMTSALKRQRWLCGIADKNMCQNLYIQFLYYYY